MNRALIRKLKLPHTVNGFVIEDANGDYNIYINDAIADNRITPTLIHELKHAAYGHLQAIDDPLADKEHAANL